MIAGCGSRGRCEGSAVWLYRLSLCARHGPLHAAFDRARAQQRGRVVPERRGEGVAHIGAGEADIGQHAAVEPGQLAGLAAVAASASSEANARTSVPAAMGKTGIFALMSVSIRFAD